MQNMQRLQQLRQLQQQGRMLRGAAANANAANVTPQPTFSIVFDQPTSGLANLGNTCYMNAVIECLRHCSPFMRYLFGQEFHEDRVCFVNRKPMQLAFLAEFREMLRELETNTDRPTMPSKVYKLLVLFNPIFGGYQQADAQECFNTITQVLHDALTVRVRLTNELGTGDSEAIRLQRTGNTRYATHIEKNGYSIIEGLFGSQFLSKLVCQSCNNVSYSHDAYSLVPVPIPEKALTLYDCIDEFIRAEVVDGISCEHCCKKSDQRVNAMKQMSFWTLPQVFVVQLKRFDHHLRKLDKFIQAPLMLNMTQYVTHPKVLEQIQHNPNALQMYDLKGIICHTGQVSGGHYTAKCLRPQNGPGNGPCWVEFNDTRTRTIQNLEELQSNQNYILFYEMNEATKRFW